MLKPRTADWGDFIASLDPRWGVTLESELSLSPDALNEKAKLFLNKVQRSARGRNWAQYSRCAPTIAVGAIERLTLNQHLHLAIACDPDLDRIIANAHKLWRGIRPSGNYWSQRLDNPAGYSSYITKGLWREANSEHIFVYSHNQNAKQ